MDVVIVATGPNLGQVFQLAGDKPLVIGRHSPAIKLLDSRVSRSHAQLVPCDGGWRLKDLQSSNGTFLNGKQLDADAELSLGDRLQVGQTLMIYTRLAAVADSDQIALNDPAITPTAGASSISDAPPPAGPLEQSEPEHEDDVLDDSDLSDLIGSSDKAQSQSSGDFADLLLEDAAPSEAGGLLHDPADSVDQPDSEASIELDDDSASNDRDQGLDLPAGVEIEPTGAGSGSSALGDGQSADLLDDDLSGSGLDLADGIEIELLDPEPDPAGPISSDRPESPVDNRADLDQDESDEPEILSDLLNPSAGPIMDADDDDDSDQSGLSLNLEDDDDDDEPRG